MQSISPMAHSCSVCELLGAYLLDEAIILLCTQVKHTTLVVESEWMSFFLSAIDGLRGSS